MAARKMSHQIPDGANTQLPEKSDPFRPHSLQRLYRGVQSAANRDTAFRPARFALRANLRYNSSLAPPPKRWRGPWPLRLSSTFKPYPRRLHSDYLVFIDVFFSGRYHNKLWLNSVNSAEKDLWSVELTSGTGRRRERVAWVATSLERPSAVFCPICSLPEFW